MTIYVIIAQPGTGPDQLEAAVRAAYPGEALTVATGVCLVSARGTAREVSEKVGITNGSENGAVGAAIVMEGGANYWGRASGEVWSWLKNRTEVAVG